jgi:hypothetical protein
MAPALFKRHKMSPECMLDQPVPLSYYNTANGEFHPRTIRQLINLKSNKFVQDKRNQNIDVTAKEFTQFQVEFRETLFGMFDNNANIHQSDLDKEFQAFHFKEDIKEMGQRERIMGVDVPQSISAAVEAMTDEELDLAFEEITEPLTLTEQTEIGNIQIPTFLEATHAGGRGRGSGRGGRGGRGGTGRGQVSQFQNVPTGTREDSDDEEERDV